jgi:hypothetical protein
MCLHWFSPVVLYGLRILAAKPRNSGNPFEVSVTSGNRCMAARLSSVERCVYWRENWMPSIPKYG